MLFYIDGLTGEHIEIGPSLFGCVLMDSCLVGMQKETLDNGKTVMKVVKLKIDTREYTEIARYEIEGYEPTEFYGVSFDGKTIYYTMVNYNEMNKAHTTDFGIYRLDIESGESFKVSDEGMPVGLTENSTLQYCVL